MAVPAHDSRDYAFARHFGIEIIPVVEGGNIEVESYDAKAGKMINSGFLTGMDVTEAIPAMFDEVEKRGLGKKLINYRLRDAIFSRQRYWGEPFPVYYKGETAYPLPEDKLPLELPPIENFGPTEQGEPPLARVKDWTFEGCQLEYSTMPGFAGSSAYYLRYMDPRNTEGLVSKEANEYWRNVDLYVGGIEHATGHLMYSRFWNMFLYDLGYVCESEPFKKLVNQGMIQGRSNFVYRVVGTNKFVSLGLKGDYQTQEIHVDVNIVKNDQLDLDAFRAWRPEFRDAEFILEDGKYICGWAVEKMSKSMFNVVNPDNIVETTEPTHCVCMRCSSARWSSRSLGIPTVLTVYISSCASFGVCSTARRANSHLTTSSLHPQNSRRCTRPSRRYARISRTSRTTPRLVPL